MSWRDRLLPASFRNCPFYIVSHDLAAGRRSVGYEYPQLDMPRSEDLGRRQRRYQVRGYVIGDDYDIARDKLLKACELYNYPATLVHPYLGSQWVRCEAVREAESDQRGGEAVFDMLFIEAGGSPIVYVTDGASTFLSGLSSLIAAIRLGFTYAYLIATNPNFLTGLALNALGGLAGNALALLGMPASLIPSVAAALDDIVFAAGDPTNTGAAVSAAFSTIATGIVASLPTADATGDIVTGTTSPPAAASDPSYGLAALTTWGADLAPIAGVSPLRMQAATNQQAIIDLVRDSAVMALATVYVQTDWTSANAALAARTQLVQMIDARSDAAAAAFNDPLFNAWQGAGALAVAYLGQEAQSLPTIGPYTIPMSVPAVALAQRLYRDSTRADELVMLNDVRHPAFMPATGQAATS